MSKAESADLILKLYDLRREATMREARNWFFSFNPKSAQDYMATMMDPQVGAYLRMVASYWDMAAALVNHGAIDAEMFSETNGEHMIVFAKIKPILAELRTMFEEPKAFSHLERLIMDSPNGAEKLRKTQAWMASLAEQMANNQTSEAAA